MKIVDILCEHWSVFLSAWWRLLNWQFVWALVWYFMWTVQIVEESGCHFIYFDKELSWFYADCNRLHLMFYMHDADCEGRNQADVLVYDADW